ncbi:Uncharacterized protein APZ42_009105 [Daphnia magna]|uniref:Uncharacterized protein n=1 Tax=Daphnia magna TaxID=35525 RepID=A0A162CZC7_9CRUS|nr:Uncharacterized protein APZ42_009105 [Daphnia magna]
MLYKTVSMCLSSLFCFSKYTQLKQVTTRVRVSYHFFIIRVTYKVMGPDFA